MDSQLSTRIVGKSVTRQLAIVGSFTALYAVLRYIPTFPLYGVPGSSFRAGDFLAPILGILLGPWLAVPCIIFGTIINYAAAPPVFLGLDFLPASIAAVVAGLITSGRRRQAIAVYAALLGIFLVLPLSSFWITIPSGIQVPYTWLHLVALVLLVSPLGLNAYKWTKSYVGLPLILGLLVVVLSATMAEHITGGILYELILFPTFKITTAAKAYFVWRVIFYLYPIERLIITAVTTVFGVSIIRVIRRSGLEEVLARVRGPRIAGPTPTRSNRFRGLMITIIKKSDN